MTSAKIEDRGHTTDIKNVRNVIEEFATACMLANGDLKGERVTALVRSSDELLELSQRVDLAISKIFAERDYARYMCDAIRREFGAGLDDPRPFILPWEVGL